MAGSETCMLGYGSSLDVTGSWPEIGVSGNYNQCQIQNFFDTIHTVLRPHDLSYPSESTCECTRFLLLFYYSYYYYYDYKSRPTYQVEKN